MRATCRSARSGALRQPSKQAPIVASRASRFQRPVVASEVSLAHLSLQPEVEMSERSSGAMPCA